MAYMVVTADVSKFDTLWLNAVQPLNMDPMVVTADVLKFDTL